MQTRPPGLQEARKSWPQLARSAEKVWERHVVHRADGEPDLLYIDLHLVHEVTSPAGLRRAAARRAAGCAGPTSPWPPWTTTCRPPASTGRIEDPISAKQMEVLAANCAEFGIALYPMGDPGQGIVHIIGPEQGLTQPGMTIVCGDSHTSTHGAFGALAFGIGTSEVEHVLATQTLPADRAGDHGGRGRRRRSRPASPPRTSSSPSSAGSAPAAASATSSSTAARPSARLSMEGRMTVCNMSIEAGARAGLVAPDDTTFAYLEGRPHAPPGHRWEQALDDWRSLVTDDGAAFDKEVVLDAAGLTPQ